MFKIYITIIIALLLFSAYANAQEPKHIWTQASNAIVIDGDTLEIEGQIIKLRGIDAPEIGQKCSHKGHLWSCGMNAALDLRKMLFMSRMASMHCWVFSKNSLWQNATCYLNDRDIAATLLTAGLVAPLSSASPHYVSLKHQAIEGGLGIWGSNFISSEKWIHGERLEGEGSQCAFKTYTTKQNEKAFITPFDKGYENLSSQTTSYCSDETALNDGYKHILP